MHDDYPSSSEDSPGPSRPHSQYRESFMSSSTSGEKLDPASYGILNGTIGGNFGRFPRNSTYSTHSLYSSPNPAIRNSVAFSDIGIDLNKLPHTPEEDHEYGSSARLFTPDQGLLWDKENADIDDYLHEPNPALDRKLDRDWGSWDLRGVIDTAAMGILTFGLIALFLAWPVYQYRGGFLSLGATDRGGAASTYNINSSVSAISGARTGLIDIDTPANVKTRTGFDGEDYNLVFSDEFNTAGRTFWPGDDPYWEAVNLHYWQTSDAEWYDPDAITTEDGKLVITVTEEPINNLSFRSGMLQSWNKLCFTGGYIEVSMSLPGNSHDQAFWPAAWTIGNLARAGYGATNDGAWPYSYGSCDVGTMPNQTYADGSGPLAAKTSGIKDYGHELSWLPGQRASACTCPGEDHPGPNVKTGRGAPEIDIIEGEIGYPTYLNGGTIGKASQSIQVAPFDAGYYYKNTSEYVQIWNATTTIINSYVGGINQEAISVDSYLDTTSYDGNGYSSYGFEYDPGAQGRITWAVNASQSWQLNAAAMGPTTDTMVGQRLVAVEPMSIVLNLAISSKFQQVSWGTLQQNMPGKLRVDYVRIYQKGDAKVTCDPDDYPTSDYINRHLDAYNNPELTQWKEGVNGTWPKNSMATGGCGS